MGSVSVRWIYLRPINLGQSEHTYVSYSYWTSEPAAYPVRLWRTLQYRYYIYGTLRDGRASTRYSTMSGSRAPAG